jgi:lyso-ornithine lipid O-acyltransferase
MRGLAMTRWCCDVRRNLRPLVILIGYLALTLPLMPLQWFFIRTSRKASRGLPIAYHRLVCRLLGVQVTVEGVRPPVSALLVSNHVSWLDIPVMSSVMPLSFIAKREVGSWALFGALAKLQRTVFVDRERRLMTAVSRNEIADRLREGDCLVLFPEGTSNDGRNLKPFKSAFFGAVEEIDVAVIPVTLAYQSTRGLPITHRQRPFYAWYGDMDLVPHLWGALRQGPLKVTVRFHPALDNTDRKTMAGIAQNTIKTSLTELLHGADKIR